MIHASVGTHGSPGGITSAPVEFAEGWNVERAASIKAIVDIPVIAVGRFSDPRTAAAVIARGDADMVAFGRQALADPDFLHKAIAGQFERIRRCLACNQGCIERLMLEPGASIRCAINPETGRELVYPRQPGTKPQKVWVIGAGPAGLTAAGESARLGHQVTLFEKEAAAGGQIRFAAQAPYKTPYQNWIDWLTRETERLGVDIKLATPVTNILIEGSDADHVILATGGEAIEPSIPGIERDHVFQAMQILQGELKPGRDVVVIGGGLIGMKTADYLSVSGSRVTLIEMQLHSPVLKITGHGYQLHKRLRETGCRILLNTTVEAILEDAVVTVSGDRQETIRPVDQVVIAVGMKPNAELKPALEEEGIPCTTVGDAVQVRRIIEATGEGAEAAWRLSASDKH